MNDEKKDSMPRSTPKLSPVLVLDSQAHNALAFIRSLGRHGVPVIAGGPSAYLPGMLSKYAAGKYVHPVVKHNQQEFVGHLIDHLETSEYAHVYGLLDSTTSVLSRHKDRIESTGAQVGVEDWDTFRAANDKKQLFERMESVDIPIPETYAPESLEDVRHIDAEREETVVIKPRSTTTTIDTTGESHTNRMAGMNYVGPDESLETKYQGLTRDNEAFQHFPPLIQEYIDGPETMATVGIANEGELLTTFQHKKFRVYPLSGGVGAVRKGIREPLMRQYAERVVSALGWTGPVHVEFMKTYDNDFVLIEVNGRYWGSLALTVNSGIDIPWFHYQMLKGERPGPLPDRYRTDIKQRRLFFRDIQWLRENLRRGRITTIAPFLVSFFTTREELLNPSDPLPALGLANRSLDIVAGMVHGESSYPSN